MRYDIETFIGQFDTYIKANLNTYLAAIDTEKNDGFTIEKVNASAYIQQDIGEALDTPLSFNPFVIHGVTDITPIVSGPESAKTYTYDVYIVFDRVADQKNIKRLWRYQRALEDFMEEGWDKINSRLKITLESLTPQPINLRNAPSNQQWIIGIRLSFNIGG